jgi:hypothetical protein
MVILEKVQNAEIHDFYSSLNTISMIKSRMIKIGEPYRTHSDEQCIQNVSRKTWRRPFGIPMHRRDDNIKTDLKELGCEGIVWVSTGINWCRTECNGGVSLWLVNKLSASIRGEEFLAQLSEYCRLEKYSAPQSLLQPSVWQKVQNYKRRIQKMYLQLHQYIYITLVTE